jgi:hypothetical protein
MTRPDFVIPLHRAPHKKDKTGAARAKAYRQRKKQEFKSAGAAAEAEPPTEGLMPPEPMSADGATAEPSEVVPPAVTPSERSEKDFT